jgi:hypothetical protein
MNKSSVKSETKKCPSCDKTISFKAKRCPYCRQDLRNWFKRHPILTFLLILITSPLWLAALVGFWSGFTGSPSQNKSNTTPTPDTTTTFDAQVNFTGTQFYISNKESVDCQDSEITINGSYMLDHYTLGSYQIYNVGAGQFTKGDGTRLNIFETKPMDVNIRCRGNNKLTSSYYYGTF